MAEQEQQQQQQDDAAADDMRLDKTPHTWSQAVGPRCESLALTSPGGPSLQFNLDIMFILFDCLHFILTAAASTRWATLTTLRDRV